MVYGKTDQERYELKTTQLKVFVKDDEDHGYSVSNRARVRYAVRALNAAESHLSRLDPLLTDIRSRYAEALFRAGTGARRLRDHLGYVIREASVVHGPKSPVVGGLKIIQAEERPIGGARALRKIERIRFQAEQLHDLGGLPYAFAMQDLAERLRASGRHEQFAETLGSLVRDRNALGLNDDEQLLFAQLVGAALMEAGEVETALPLLEEARHQPGDPAAAVPGTGDWETGFLAVTTAACQLANGKPEDAEAVLRDALPLLGADGDDQDKHLGKLRHRTVFELGTAIFLQDRVLEAVDRFQEACDLIARTASPQEATFTAYRNTRVYAELRARGD
ncbi:hypothetical protein [Glycomyces sp. NPDC047010]|uniref:hypothetical protein n=1 Tax=Glycomyces sp. NPDC047010 TaxID=3155023 RepID=UPI0033F17EDF